MKKLKKRPGFTLVEVIVDAFVITIVFTALVAGFLIALKTVNGGRARSAASSLANQTLEQLRNLPYNSLSTQHGSILPQGSIPDTQNFVRSGSTFVVHTTIIYVDDPFDGCAIPIAGAKYRCTDGGTSTQQDTVPVDYKRITVTVNQQNSTIILASLTSSAAAKAAETPSNTGILLITVDDSKGAPIEGATVVITDASTNVNITATTNGQGYVFVANVPPDTAVGYHVVASLAGYSSDFTTARSGQTVQYQPDVFVHAQQITAQTLSIDQLATIAVTVVNETNTPVPNLTITATSQKYIQQNPLIAKNIYNQATDASGLATFNNVEWDSFAFSGPSGYFVLATSPYQNVVVSPQENQAVTLVVSTNSSLPRIISATPASGTSGTASVQVVITGKNFANNATTVLRLAGQSDIAPTSTVVSPDGTTITATFDLTATAAGSWAIVVTSGGANVTESDGFIIS